MKMAVNYKRAAGVENVHEGAMNIFIMEMPNFDRPSIGSPPRSKTERTKRYLSDVSQLRRRYNSIQKWSRKIQIILCIWNINNGIKRASRTV